MASLFDILTKLEKEKIMLAVQEAVFNELKSIKVNRSETAEEEEEPQEIGETKRFLPKNTFKAPVYTLETRTSSEGRDLWINMYVTKMCHFISGKDNYNHKELFQKLGMKYDKNFEGIGPGWKYPAAEHEAVIKRLEKEGIIPQVKIIGESPKEETKEKICKEPKKDPPTESKAPSNRVVVKKNKWGNYMGELDMVFEKIDGKPHVIGIQDKTSQEKGLESLEPLTQEAIEYCIKKKILYDTSVVSYSED